MSTRWTVEYAAVVHRSTSAPTRLSLLIVAALAGYGRQARADNAVTDKWALVIGNKLYRSQSAVVASAENDALAMAEKLSQMGFNVLGYDPNNADTSKLATLNLKNKNDFIRYIDQFSSHVNNNIVLVYFSGHGLYIDKEDFMIPVDFQASNTDQARKEGYSLQELGTALEKNKPKVWIAIFDACRSVPRFNAGGNATYAANHMRGEIQKISRPYVIATSAEPTQESKAGTNLTYSLYTKHLLKFIDMRNADILDVFRYTAGPVAIESQNAQTAPYQQNLSSLLCLREPHGICTNRQEAIYNFNCAPDPTLLTKAFPFANKQDLFDQLDLSTHITDDLNWLTTAPPQELVFQTIPFRLTKSTAADSKLGLGVIATHSLRRTHLPRRVTIPTKATGATAIHIIISGVWLDLQRGNTVGRIVATFGNGQSLDVPLVVFKNIRETWLYLDILGMQKMDKTANNVFWNNGFERGQYRQRSQQYTEADIASGFLDYLSIIVPPNLQNEELKTIAILDEAETWLSVDGQRVNPGIAVAAITIQQKK